MNKAVCTLEGILERLVSQEIVEQDKASMISSLVSAQDRKNLHPLEIIASRQWPNKSLPEQVLSLDVLTDWLAKQSGMPRFHFDPLKMDVKSCTSIMSYAYASRFGILAVRVTDDELLMAVTDPYQQEWKDELDQIVNKPITAFLPLTITWLMNLATVWLWYLGSGSMSRFATMRRLGMPAPLLQVRPRD